MNFNIIYKELFLGKLLSLRIYIQQYHLIVEK